MESYILRLLSVWIESGFERSIWQVYIYSLNNIGLVFCYLSSVYLRSRSVYSLASFARLSASRSSCSRHSKSDSLLEDILVGVGCYYYT
jgi:hypothetical protein